MIKLTEFIKVTNPDRTKIKLNMNSSNPNVRAQDLLFEGDQEWINI